MAARRRQRGVDPGRLGAAHRHPVAGRCQRAGQPAMAVSRANCVRHDDLPAVSRAAGWCMCGAALPPSLIASTLRCNTALTCEGVELRFQCPTRQRQTRSTVVQQEGDPQRRIRHGRDRMVLAALKQYPLPGRYRAGARRRGHHRLAFQAMHGDGPGTLCDGRPWPARSTRRINCRAGVLIWRVVTASRSVAPSGRTSMVLSGLACCSAIAASGATGDQRRHRAGLGGGREHRCCVAALPMHAGLRPRLKEVTEAGQCTSAGCAP